MYCGNCGKEITDTTIFCPECGARNETARVQPKSTNPQAKKPVKLGIIVVVIIALTFIGVKVFSYIQSIPSEEEIQMAANNLQNGAVVASDGKWIYYNNDGLCKTRLKDSSKKSVVSKDICAENMFFIGNNLYYYTFPGYYVLDGDKGTDLGLSVFAKDCIQYDGSKFYVTGMANYEDGGVYSCKAGNTKEGKKLSGIHPTRLLLQGEYLYVISGFNSIDDIPNENYGTWRMNKNGKGLIKIFDYCPNYLVFSGDKMYYTNEEQTICSADLDGSKEVIFEGAVANSGLNVSKDYIFYIAFDTHGIQRMDKNGSNKVTLNYAKSGKLNIVGDWIFYEKQNYDYVYEIYMMRFDGSENQPLEGGIDCADYLTDIFPVILRDSNIGDSVIFGKYEQDNDTSNGAEDIAWLVLDKQDGKVLLLSKDALDCLPYHQRFETTTWETCTLREWLNEDFLNEAFSSEEKRMISWTTVKADRNPGYNTDPGDDTQDQVFLLSIPEVNRYFESDSQRQCKPTPYAVARYTYVNEANDCCNWWLRSPGEDNALASDVQYEGNVNEPGYVIVNSLDAVRPAIWINLES